MSSVVFIPLCDSRVLMHVFDDVAPADTGIVRTERDLTFLRSVRNDAHFCAAEIIVEQVLEPHAGDKEEVPRILAAFLDVLDRTVGSNLSIVLAGQTKRLIKFLYDSDEL